MTTGIREWVSRKREEGLAQLPPVLTELPGEVLRAGMSITVNGLGVPDGTQALVVSPTLGLVGRRIPTPVNRTGLRELLK